MTIQEACDKAVAAGYHVHCLAGVDIAYSGAGKAPKAGQFGVGPVP